MTAPTIAQMIEASAEAKREIGEWSDDNGDRHPYLNEAQDGITALLRTLQEPSDEVLERMAKAHHAASDPAVAWEAMSQSIRALRCTDMRAALHAITGEGE